MKNSNFLAALTLVVFSSMLSSCEIIGDIFKAGMGFGIFLVIAVVALVIWLVMRMGKK